MEQTSPFLLIKTTFNLSATLLALTRLHRCHSVHGKLSILIKVERVLRQCCILMASHPRNSWPLMGQTIAIKYSSFYLLLEGESSGEIGLMP
ncbi:hypothetical protein NPIL_562751 [Nephila pilipes]|uniref:Uncharacterized protein n=1 Tax=Nephila pilipes TaxID=299642 RepID=A0A8X6ULB1_NEPPI|nr:hypothetical protein NPIL_562751 [Nephila pilipes]